MTVQHFESIENQRKRMLENIQMNLEEAGTFLTAHSGALSVLTEDIIADTVHYKTKDIYDLMGICADLRKCYDYEEVMRVLDDIGLTDEALALEGVNNNDNFVD